MEGFMTLLGFLIMIAPFLVGVFIVIFITSVLVWILLKQPKRKY